MQSNQFDKLMNGEKSLWGELNKDVPDMKSPIAINKQIRKHLDLNELDIPVEKEKEIQEFILMLTKVKPKLPMYEIRKRVKTKFNITVV